MGYGAQRWPRECSTCGKTYILTNFMWRWVEEDTLKRSSPYSRSTLGPPVMRVDTHQLRHLREQHSLPTEPAPDDAPRGGDT
jgi:hypothetical protein